MRYQVRMIRDAEMTELCDEVQFSTDDKAEAEAWASGNFQHGAAVVDTVEGTIDWGHAVTKGGEPAPAGNWEE